LREKPELLAEVVSKHEAEFALIGKRNPQGWAARQEEIALPKGKKVLRVPTLHGVLWYHACKQKAVTVTLLHDPQEAKEGKWRDEVLLRTRVGATAAEMGSDYGKRWSVELAFHDSQQYLGLEDPEVRTEQSVQRAHPMAWFCLSLVVLWYALNREQVEKVSRDRPW
jgi:hypothetical protein